MWPSLKSRRELHKSAEENLVASRTKAGAPVLEPATCHQVDGLDALSLWFSESEQYSLSSIGFWPA
jgi:hypothetical protein